MFVNEMGAPVATPTGSGSFMATQGYQYLYVYGDSVDATISNPTLASASTGPFGGGVNTSTIAAAGSGYAVNDTGFFSTGNGNAAYKITSVAGGAVTGYTITTPGTGYAVGNDVTTFTGGAQPGAGTGFAINLTAVTGVAYVGVSVTASMDPQVNQIRVFRITDTGTGAVFFELPTSPYPNTTQTIQDSAADTSLVVTNAITVGTLNFSPPPAGLQLMAWYGGRMWGAVGNLLYFSAGPDNTPLGDQPGANAWPPQNVFALPNTIVKLEPLSGGNGMIVVTTNRLHIVQGISNPGYTVNIWLKDIGARSQNAVDSDGSTIYMFTSDRQFLQISGAGINELSQTVSDLTDTYDPTQVYVCQHRSGSQDSRVFLSNGSTTLLPYNLMSSCWEPLQTPVDGGGVGAIASIEIQPGVYKFLKGATTAGQLVLQRDLQTFTDNGTQYTWQACFGNIPLADPRQLANVDSLVLRMTNAGNLPTVSILPNDIQPGVFKPLNLQEPKDEPPEAAYPPVGHRAKRYDMSAGADLWAQMLHCQVLFSFPVSAAQEEILTWGLFPNTSADQPVGTIPAVQGR